MFQQKLGSVLKRDSLAFCGNLTLDELIRSSSHRILPGGSEMFGSGAAAFLGARVGIIGNVGIDYPQSILKNLESLGIDLSRLNRAKGPSTRFRNISSNGARKLFLLEGGVQVQNPSLTRRVEGVHLGPVFQEIPSQLVTTLRAKAGFMSVDLQGFVRITGKNGRVSVKRRNLAALLKACNMVQASIEEARTQAPTARRSGVLDWLNMSGPKYSILTLGGEGALVGIRPDERFVVPAFRDGFVKDTTGAGDVFAGSWLSTFLTTKDPVWAASVGSAFASLASRKTGLSKFRLSRRELFRRASWVYNHVRAVPS
jgi:sugar/nucleoside kinase (ribokinase family)